MLYSCFHTATVGVKGLRRQRWSSKQSNMIRYVRHTADRSAMGSARKPEIGRQLGSRMRSGHICPLSGRRLSCLRLREEVDRMFPDSHGATVRTIRTLSFPI